MTNRMWLQVFDLAAKRPWVGTVLGTALVAVLIPVLTLAGGNSGTLGPSIPLFFLVPMLLASTFGGRVAGIVVSVVAVAAWDWFFIPPLHQAIINYPRDVLTLVIFLFDAILTGQLAKVVRQRAEEAIQRAGTSEALYDLSVALIGSHDLPVVLGRMTQRLTGTFDLQACAILLRNPATSAWTMAASSGSIPPDLDVGRSRTVTGVIAWVEANGKTCTLGADDGPEARDLERGGSRGSNHRADFWPLRVGMRLVGVLEIIYKPGTPLNPQRENLLRTLVNGVAIALEQERLFHEEQEAAIVRESDQLKSALLSSVSHDLRTPLAGIKAAASSLLQTDVQWSESDREAFAVDIDSEADRLTRLVSNLLDLSRIEAGAIVPNAEWDDVRELVDRVVRRLQPRFATHQIVVDTAGDVPPMRLDTVHIEQALTNLIENAAKYSPDGTPIRVRTSRAAPPGSPWLRLSIEDRGPGIEPSEQEKIFDKFYRIAGSARRSGGTGMGLAIVKGLVEADGGWVEVDSRLGEGTTFSIVLPIEDSLRDESDRVVATGERRPPA